MSDTVYAKPLPRIDDANRPFWEGTRQGELRLLHCGDCGHVRYQPYKTCGSCGGERSEWRAASGRGTIWSYGFFHQVYFKGFADEAPYNVIVVELEEGPRIYSNLVGAGREALRIGLPVEAVFEPVTDEVTLVKFRPRG